jgi:hypothetical protein
VNLDELIWQCGDCGNTYEYSVKYCVNNLLDKLAAEKAHHDFMEEQYANEPNQTTKDAIEEARKMNDRDELLAKLNDLDHSCSVVGVTVAALRAVVELHKPVEVPHNDYATGLGCSAPSCLDKYAEPSPYPCETIQAIEKELG